MPNEIPKKIDHFLSCHRGIPSNACFVYRAAKPSSMNEYGFHISNDEDTTTTLIRAKTCRNIAAEFNAIANQLEKLNAEK